MTAANGSFVDVLRYRAAAQPDARAYVALSDRGGEEASVTFAELAERAEGLARRVAAQAAPGERALLLCPNGVGFMVGFFACMLAGVIAVPMMLPRRGGRDASAGIVADCTPRLALAPRALIAGERGDLTGRFAQADLAWQAVDGDDVAAAGLPAVRGDDIAFLQYTSGSTSAPKGVVVSHANLLANLEMIRLVCGNTAASTYVSWVPLYHDMGLILNALQALYVGALCVLLAPVAFLQRPHLWLRAIADYHAEVAGGPNFAFDLCVDRHRPEQLTGVDLSDWKLAFVGAEPIRANTIERFIQTFRPYGFAPEAFWPGYGMAEATLLVSGSRRGAGPILRPLSRSGLLAHKTVPPRDDADVQRVVGCGRALPDEAVVIVDPQSRRRRMVGDIGEIWVAGGNIANGYWRNPEASAAAFGGKIAGEEGRGRRWLRTGDLGFLDGEGELFITGRVKDVIILRGANHYPQDIEDTVQSCDPALRRHAGAAFTVGGGEEIERLVIVQEVERTARHSIVPAEMVGRIREAVIAAHDVAPHDIALLRPGALPKTTSGKIQRALSRQLWLEGALDGL